MGQPIFLYRFTEIGGASLVGAMFLLIPGIAGLAFVSGHITYRNRNKIQARLAGVTAKLAEKIDDIEVIIVVPPTLLMFNGAIDRAVYVAYLTIALRFETYVKEHPRVWVSLKEAQGATRRLSTVLDLDNERDAAGAAAASGDITFTDVSFAYAEESILKSIPVSTRSATARTATGAC